MTITISDPALIEAFRQTTGEVLVTDPSGEVICSFTPNNLFRLPPGVKSPFTDEELEERMKDEESDITPEELFRQLQARG